MKQQQIRKNIISNVFEHKVSKFNGVDTHWSPGFIGNDIIDNKEQTVVAINRDTDNFVVIYEDVQYNKIQYDCIQFDYSTMNKAITELNQNLTVKPQSETEVVIVNPAETI